MASGALRPVDVRRDLGQIADLIELCFADTMDSVGRAAVQDLRSLARLGPGLWLVSGMSRFLRGFVQGFVWEAGGQVVGNVSIYPAGYAACWVVANVAVHPDWRGQGIAQALCRAALERITAWGGRRAILQVDEPNHVARHIYLRLGFWEERTFTHWVWRGSSSRPPQALPDMPHITYRAWHEWRKEYALARLLRPPERGGMGWLKPTEARFFRTNPLNIFSFSRREHWVVRGAGPDLAAVVITEGGLAASQMRFEMLVHPSRQGELETPLLNYFIRQALDRYRGLYTEHPADDLSATFALEQAYFRPTRHLVHMRWEAGSA